MNIRNIACWHRWVSPVLALICLFGPASAQAASVSKKIVTVTEVAKDVGFVNDADNLTFFQPVHPNLSGFVSQANGKWAFTSSDGAGGISTVDAVGLQFNGNPALLGIPAEVGTLTIGANNEIADLWTDRIFYRPVVFVTLEDPNLNSGVAIVPTAPITQGNQFLFDVRQATGFNADLTGAKVHYLIAEEGWHRLADGQMLLISSAEVKHTGFSGKTIALGASFESAVTVAQLQRPMLFHNGTLFRNLLDMTVYQGATVTEGVGNFDSITLRLMQETSVEESNTNTVYAGRIGFMVLGNISSIANTFNVVKDTNTNIRGGSYLTVPQSNFQFFPHSAAATPLLNRVACAEDDDVQNFCVYLSMPVDAMSRGVFDTPRLPYMDANFDPLQMERTFYSEVEWNWQPVIEPEMMNPITDTENKPIVGTLAKMFPNFVADRGWNEVIIGDDDLWHWFATYHYDTCVFDSRNTACVDYAPGNTIIEDKPIGWTASLDWFDLESDSFFVNNHPSSSSSQFLLAVEDANRRNHAFFYERLTPEDWAAKQTLDYLNLEGSTMRTPLSEVSPSYNETKELLESYAETWQFFGINVQAEASEYYCGTCDGPVPLLDTGDYKSVGGFDIFVPTMLADRIFNQLPFYRPETTRPLVDKVGQSMRVGDYMFANIPYSMDATDFVWMRSATGQASDAVVVASDVFGYQATNDDANAFVTMCMTFRNSQRCGKWIEVGQYPFVTDVKIKPQYDEPIAGSGLIGQYTYIAPNNNAYDGLEYNSLYQWQYALADEWVDYAGENDITFQRSVSAGTQIRFCVTPRSHALSGDEACSVGVKMQLDTDGDGISDDWDIDDDNDGYADWEDRLPKDPSEYLDTDRDGIGNNADTDDDNDGLSDDDEITAGSDPLIADTDGDGTLDGDDPAPTVYGDLPDFDGDGIADIDDADRDNDGVVDFLYQIDSTNELQTLVDENDVVLHWARIDDNPYQACTASQITVTSNADSGPGTLRQALIDLCASEPGADLNIINFNGPMTIMLESPLVIGKGMKIDGNKTVVLDGQNTTAIFTVALPDRMLQSQFPHLVGLTLRNGFTQVVDADASTAVELGFDSLNQASAVHMHSSTYLFMEHMLIENMSAPAISGNNVQLYLENSLVANVSGLAPAFITANGQIALFSSTLYNSEGGAMSVGSEGKAQLRNSLLLKGPNGSTVCNVDTWDQQTTSWVEGSECGITSTGSVTLADPGNGDYRPVPGSANIDAGLWEDDPAAAGLDLLGNARVMGEYNPDYPQELGGPLIPQMDIGAIEYVYAGDFDGDGTNDTEDAFPNDATETTDTDGDGIGDNQDALPDDANETLDTDGDGIGNNTDTDDDNDQYNDDLEIEEGSDPLDANSIPLDTDGDLLPNSMDNDDDNDGVIDASDVFPLDVSESVDTDGDGTGNNADSDDDNDGYSDAIETSEGSDPLSDVSKPLDTDGDFLPNSTDVDDDNDGVADAEDAFPLNASESVDTDGDGTGNNADSDDDNDGVDDDADAFPLDAAESADSDGDGIGDSADTDDDNDGYADSVEITEGSDPLSASNTPQDTDGDFEPNSTDTDDDNDSVPDASDAFPLDSTEWSDSDGDGVGDNSDPDRDGDGINDDQEPNVAPVISLSVKQNGRDVTTVYADQGEFEVVATVVDENPTDKHSFQWVQFVGNDSTLTLDPAQLATGLQRFTLVVTDDGEGNLSSRASVRIRVRPQSPVLSDTDDSDNDGISDSEEGLGDADGDRIPDYLDAVNEANQMPANSGNQMMQTEAGLQLILGDITFAAGNPSAQVSLEDIAEYLGGNVDDLTDPAFELNGMIVDFIVAKVEVGTSVRVVIPQQTAIPANASYRKYISGMGWQAFIEDVHNQIASAPSDAGVCPATGDAAYQPGLTEGHDCVQITIQDGGPNDADGKANGEVHDPSVVASSLPAPTVSASLNEIGEGTFSQNDGERVVLSFKLVSDSDDAQVSQLSIQASGDLDETNDVGSVKLYLDSNQDGVADGDELVGEGQFSTDNGNISFVLSQAVRLAAGETQFLVTYEF